MSREVSKFREKLEKLTHARSLDTRPFFFLPRAKRAARLPAREKRGTGDEASLDSINKLIPTGAWHPNGEGGGGGATIKFLESSIN